jgi:hypothetical protein
MKRFTLLTGIAMLISLSSFAQEIENKLPKNHQEWADRSWPVTDTLVFDFPNEGKLSLLFNRDEFSVEELLEEFKPLMQKATNFPDFTTLYYRVCNNFYPTMVNSVKNQIERKYVKWGTSIQLGLPIGLDFTAGKFTPEIGFQVAFFFPGYQIGGSITNTVYFPEAMNSEISVNNNWFINAEYSWKFGSLYANRYQTIQIGYLLNNSKSQLFEGTTMRATYNQTLSRHISVQGGFIGTKNMKTYYPVVGFRIRF